MTGLVKRGSVYYLRIRVPADLLRVFEGRREIWKSLRTKDREVAIGLRVVWVKRFWRLRELLRSRMLSEQQMRRLASEFLREQLDAFEGNRAGGVGYQKDWNETPLEEFDRILEDLKSDLARPPDGGYMIRVIADDFIEFRKIPVEQDSQEYRRLLWHLTHAFLHFVEVERERRLGNYANPYDSLIWEATSAGQVPGGVNAEDSRLISSVIADYVAEKTAANRWEPKTVQQNQASLNLMLEILGDKPIRQVTHHEMLRLRETIRKLPGNKSKSRAYRGKTIDAILRMKGIKPMSTVTCNNILTRIASFWNWAHRHEYVDRTPAHDLLVPTSKRADEERAVYTKDELQLLVDAVAKFGKAEARPERIWVPLIAMFSGMRPNEIAQLYTDDIVEEDGVPCFRVADTHPGQKVKNRNARRFVPIHPFLLEYGFNDYLTGVAGNSTGRVFPRLRKHRDGYFAYLGRWFQKINRAHITKDRQKVFYSLRHNFITALKESQVPETLVAELVGHAVSGETVGRYGKRFKPDILLETLKKVDYGLNMTAIKNAARKTFET